MVDWVFEHAKQNVQIARKHKHMLFLVDVRDVWAPKPIASLENSEIFCWSTLPRQACIFVNSILKASQWSPATFFLAGNGWKTGL